MSPLPSSVPISRIGRNEAKPYPLTQEMWESSKMRGMGGLGEMGGLSVKYESCDWSRREGWPLN